VGIILILNIRKSRGRRAPYQNHQFSPNTAEEVVVATVHFVNFGERRNWNAHGDMFTASSSFLWDFWSTVYNVESSFIIVSVFWELYRAGRLVKKEPMAGPGCRPCRYVVPDCCAGRDIENTVCGTSLPGDIIDSIMMFVDWEDKVKLGFFSDALQREGQVVLNPIE
jgi:hypothetical protein